MVLTSKHGFEVLQSKNERISFVLCQWHKIIPARKNFPDGTDHAGDVFDAVNNHIPVINKNNIAVFTHNFHNKALLTQIAHFV